MRTGTHCLTPLAAIAGGLLAGAVGTVGLKAVHCATYRRAGGTQSALAWEFAPVDNWDQAPDPGQVARRVIEGFTQRKLPDRWTWPVSTAASGAGLAARASRRDQRAHIADAITAVTASGCDISVRCDPPWNMVICERARWAIASSEAGVII